MRYIKKLFTVLLCFIMVSTVFSGFNTANAAVTVPSVAFVGVDHSPLVVGDSESFYITTNYTGNVQYRIFLYTESTKKYEELTKGYSASVDGKMPYKVTPSKVFQLGKYKVLTYVKRAGVTGIKSDSRAGSYDTLYTSFLNCVNRDNANRVYANDEMDVSKDTVSVGETITINGIKNISGMSGPYTYKLHIFGPENMEWTNDVQAYRGPIEWTPSKPGVYVFDLWAISADSTLWKLINSNPSAKLYESWKLKVITVTAPEKYISIKQDTPLLLSIGGSSDSRYAVSGEKYSVYEEKDGYYKIKSGKIYGYIPVSSAEVLPSKPEDKVNLAWQPVYYESNNKYTYDEPIDFVNTSTAATGIDAVSPTWFYIKGDASNISSIYAGEIIDNEYVNRAHRNGYEVWPRFYEDDPNRAKAVFNTPSLRTKVIADVVQNAIDADADGVNIDFEGLGTYTECKNDFTAFVRDLSAALHSRGISVSIDVTRPEVNSRYSSYFDRAALSEYCDYVVLMAYDEHYATSQQPGSVGSYPWVQDSINKTIAAGVPADKLILGNPLYSYDYSAVQVNTALAYNTAVALRNTFAYSAMIDDEQHKTSAVNSGEVLKKTAVSSDGKWYTVTIGSSQQYVKKSDFVPVPAYGTGLWTAASESLKIKDAQDKITANSGTTYYDSSAKQTVASYEKDGIKHYVWLENLDSMNWRTDFVSTYGLKGAAAWAISFETQDIWSAYKKLK